MKNEVDMSEDERFRRRLKEICEENTSSMPVTNNNEISELKEKVI